MTNKNKSCVLASLAFCVASICSFVVAPSLQAEESVVNAELREIRSEPGACDQALGHVQGIACDENAIYAVFANLVCKFDWTGKLIKSTEAPFHAGDPCVANDKLYVSMSTESAEALFEYDLDLNLTRKLKLEKCPGGDGVAFLNGKFYVGGPSSDKPHLDNYVLVYDENFNLIDENYINYGVPTAYGPQSIASWKDRLFVAFYIDGAPEGSPRAAIVGSDLKTLSATTLDGSNGWALAPESRQLDKSGKTALLLVGRTDKVDGKTIAAFRWFKTDGEKVEDVTQE